MAVFRTNVLDMCLAAVNLHPYVVGVHLAAARLIGHLSSVDGVCKVQFLFYYYQTFPGDDGLIIESDFDFSRMI